MPLKRTKPIPALTPITRQRFWAKVERRGPVPAYNPSLGCCWLWTAYIGPEGYGGMTVRNSRLYAHRVAYALVVGPIPADRELDHLCRVRHCVNPAHLEPVTRGEHIRRRPLKTHCKHGHPFSGDNLIQTAHQRQCRTCREASARRRRLRSRKRSR